MTIHRPRDLEPWEEPAFGSPADRRCPSPDVLLPAAEGTLPEPVLSRVRAHAAGCPLCRELTAALQTAADAAPTPDEEARLAAAKPARGSPRLAWWPVMAAAAAILAVTAVSVAWLLDATPPASPAAQPVRVEARARGGFLLPLEPPRIDLPRTPLVLRGAPVDPYVTELIRAVEPLRAGAYAEAAEGLQRLHDRYPQRPHSSFYLGVALLLGGQVERAITPLERARDLAPDGGALRSDASWYLAVAFERAGRRHDAIATLTVLCGSGGSNDARACLSLHRLLTPELGRGAPDRAIPPTRDLARHRRRPHGGRGGQRFGA